MATTIMRVIRQTPAPCFQCSSCSSNLGPAFWWVQGGYRFSLAHIVRRGDAVPDFIGISGAAVRIELTTSPLPRGWLERRIQHPGDFWPVYARHRATPPAF